MYMLNTRLHTSKLPVRAASKRSPDAMSAERESRDPVTSVAAGLLSKPYLAPLTHNITYPEAFLIISQNSIVSVKTGVGRSISENNLKLDKMSFSEPTLNASYASVTDPGKHR